VSGWLGRTLRAGLALSVVLLAGACRPDDQETRTLDVEGEQTRAQLAPEVVEALDSGTQAFRDHRFEDALDFYRSAADAAPDEPAGWFGISIAQRALGNMEAAESAMVKVRDLAPGATILHPDDTVGTGGGEGGGGL
jgi:hypothetical protein